VGGTIRNIGRIHRRALDYPLEIAHNYQMDLDAVKIVCKTAAELNLEERRELKGLSKGRSDIFIGASHAVMMVMECIGSKSLIISDAGVRDGLIYTYFGRTEGDLIDNIFESSLGYAVDRFTVNIPHSRHIYELSDQLYTQLEPIHGVNGSLDRIRKTSAMLHDAGIMIQYNNHHEHSFYLILSAGINGLTQKELLMSAFVALNHRTQKKIKIDAIYTSMLDEKSLEIIDLLSLFLQIAEYLDRSMDGIVTDLSCDIQEDAVVLHVTSKEASVFTDMIISECGKKFKRVMGKELVIENEIVK
ncbi:Ppx/GppA phosphatase family protein, partial [Eubacterium aggregans]|uniref:Ppx/GppA phosphatase family protein n=1 Tax=Eubacterium aggregans TaxID=81409 RepID=UPI003F30C019